MMPDWHTNYVYFSDLLPGRHPAVWQGLKRALSANGIGVDLLPGTRDIWCRDYMPVQVANADFVKFRYEPDYLRDCRSLATDPTVCRAVPDLRSLRVSAINLYGGNVVAASRKVILTDKVFRENQQHGKKQLTMVLEQLFGAECVFIPVEPGDTIGHADGVVRFLDEQTVVVNDFREDNRDYGTRLTSALRRHDLRIEKLPYFCTGEMVDGIPSAVGNYVNYLRVQCLVVVPAYGVPQDAIAIRKLERLLPDTKVVALRCEGLARGGGVLNCVSWTLRREQA